MAKHQKEEGLGLALIGTPDELVKRIVTDKKEQKEVLNAIINEGPPHKQVYSALLLRNMSSLVKCIEQYTGQTFSPLDGSILSSHKDEVDVPIPFAAEGIRKKDLDAVEEAAAHSPAHEIAAFNTLLQGMAWSIAAMKDK